MSEYVSFIETAYSTDAPETVTTAFDDLSNNDSCPDADAAVEAHNEANAELAEDMTYLAYLDSYTLPDSCPADAECCQFKEVLAQVTEGLLSDIENREGLLGDVLNDDNLASYEDAEGE